MTDADRSRTVPPPAEPESPSDARVVTQFFVIPLLVVAGLVGVFYLFSRATRGPESPEDMLRTLRSGRFNQRWQAAFELATLLRREREVPVESSLVREIAQIFGETEADREADPRIRRYLALALGESGSPDAVVPLLEGASDRDGETRLFSLGGLARLRSPSAEPVFLSGLNDTDPSVRSVCAYGLGMIPATGSLDQLHVLLADPIDEVRWNAALALGRKGDPAGEEILVQLLDRRYLDGFRAMRFEEKSEVILNALRALMYLKTKGLNDRVSALVRSDPDPVVRQAAAAQRSETRP